MSTAVLARAVFSVTLNALAQIALRKTMLAVGPLPSVATDALRFLISLVSIPGSSGACCAMLRL